MVASLEALGIDRLSVEDRLKLVEEIWDSIATDSTALPLTPDQRQELERRVAARKANPEEAVPWSSQGIAQQAAGQVTPAEVLFWRVNMSNTNCLIASGLV
ncbi:MAG: addiction module protein [Proteobacteria bacterium]|nr:addiction module protein [Pseudomonadota bacterium]